MSKRIELTVINREDRTVRDKVDCHKWSIKYDYVNNDRSEFILTRQLVAKKGDFVIGKLDNGKMSEVLPNQRLKPFYFGIVDSNETTDGKWKMTAVHLINLVNFDFAATKKYGRDVGEHMLNLLQLYFFGDPTKLSDGIVVRLQTESIVHAYQPSSPPTVTNLTDYFINIFKKYRVTWSVEWVGYDDSNRLVIATVLGTSSKELMAKNNISDFFDWDVLVSPANRSTENMLLIVDKKTEDSERPVLLATWYVNRKGEITPNRQDVEMPTRTKLYIYDGEQEGSFSFESIARSELTSSLYSHEIAFSLYQASKLIVYEDLEIGALARLYVDKDSLPSVLTGIEMESDSASIRLKFGHLRSTLKSLIQIQGG